MEWLREYHWGRILDFVNESALAHSRPLPVFRSGNRKWLKREYAPALWALSPPLRNETREAEVSPAELANMSRTRSRVPAAESAPMAELFACEAWLSLMPQMRTVIRIAAVVSIGHCLCQASEQASERTTERVD